MGPFAGRCAFALLCGALVVVALWVLSQPARAAAPSETTRAFLNRFRTEVKNFDFDAAWPPSQSDYCQWRHITCDGSGMASVDLSQQWLGGRFPEVRPLRGDDILIAAINMSFNPDFSGDLRSDWGTLSHLRSLDLSSTAVGDDLPDDWGSLAALELLNLSNTRVSGDVPKEWAGMSSLAVLDLRRTKVRGDLHGDEVGHGMQRLEVLQLGETELDDVLADFDAAGLFPGLQLLNVSHSRSDKPSRRLPDALAAWATSAPNLTYVEFDGYGFTGCVPNAYRSVPVLMQAARRANIALVSLTCDGVSCTDSPFLAGTTATFLRLLRTYTPGLQGVWKDVDPCRWAGVTCPDECGLGFQVDLAGLPIAGSIPDVFAGIAANTAFIDAFLARGCGGLAGMLPPSLAGALSLVRRLDLSATSLMGTIPVTFGASLLYLEHLAVANTYMGGGLPDWSMAPWPPPLRHVDLSQNRMAGPLSASWASLPLVEVNLLGNPFCGCTPSSWLQHPLLLAAVDATVVHACDTDVGAFARGCGNGNQQCSTSTARESREQTLSFLRTLKRAFPVHLQSWESKSSAYCDGSWVGVTCKDVGDGLAEVHLNLANRNLNGTLPQLPADLVGPRILVASIDFSGNSPLRGRLPVTWGRLSYLRTLVLSHNPSLVGDLPDEWEGMQSLDRLEIAKAGLCRGFPNWHAEKMPRLTHVNFYSNWMVGGLSSSFGGFGAQLTYFNAAGNNFCGCVPSTWTTNLIRGLAGDVVNPLVCSTRNKCTSTRLGCSTPNYSGNIDFSDINLIFLKEVKKTLSGDAAAASAKAIFATWVGTDYCEGWRGVTCSFNAGRNGYAIALRGVGLAGSLPTLITDFPGSISLRSLDLSDNPAITGALPPSWRRMAYLRRLSLRNTSVSSAIPSSWEQMESLAALSLASTPVCGSLPAWSAHALVSVQVLDFSDTKLSGALGGSWDTFAPSGLTTLRLSGNHELCRCASPTWMSGSVLPNAMISAFGAIPVTSDACAKTCAPAPACVDPEDSSGDATHAPARALLWHVLAAVLGIVLTW